MSPLHFNKITRGRLPSSTKIFQGEFGNFEHLENFVPPNLSKRHVVSKSMVVFDTLGKLIPLISKLIMDLRDLMAHTPTWDKGLSMDHLSTWVSNFMTIEALKILKTMHA